MYRAFCWARQIDPREVPAGQQRPELMGVMAAAAGLVRERLGRFEGRTWVDVAKFILDYSQKERQVVNWSLIDHVFAWEAAVRQAASMCADEDGLDVEALERSWLRWAKSRMSVYRGPKKVGGAA
jgi:hypothetical protein